MLNVEDRMKRMAVITGAILMATAEALAQDQQAKLARRIIVSIPDRKLAVLEGGKVVKTFPTAVGAPATPSPTGSFTIVQRLVDPTWYFHGQVVKPGKANPLGTRWMGLSAGGYGIHGTNAPGSIGHNVSHGCIRMKNQDAEELFAMVSVGDPVELVAERTPELDEIFPPVIRAVIGPRPPATVVAQTLVPGSAGAGPGNE
ncbi:MAG TPA: L,D-transpeptidase [Bryobacteraceae bacterium]|nr:L,D-transpeptidase [Bryobacteraceae bacterium]